MSYHYPYPRMLVTVDAVILRTDPKGTPVEILLVERKNNPFAGWYALPGGFPGMDERLADAARRELVEETGIEVDTLELLGVFDAPGRDPRDRNIAIAFFSLFNGEVQPKAGDDAARAAWCPIGDLPRLAFDHAAIVEAALLRFS